MQVCTRPDFGCNIPGGRLDDLIRAATNHPMVNACGGDHSGTCFDEELQPARLNSRFNFVTRLIVLLLSPKTNTFGLRRL
jgi:hypothetical protein